MDFLNFLMALSPIVVVLVGILGFKKSAKTVSPIALLCIRLQRRETR